jgi:DNA-binding transcriptional MerR regulator
MARPPRTLSPAANNLTGTPQVRRPTRDIYDIVGYTTGGQPIRVIDRAVDTLRIGGSIPDVADRCGIARETVREWQRLGTLVSADIFGGRRRMGDLTKHERKCFDFVQLTAQAEADGKAYLLGLAEKIAQGGYQITTITEKVERAQDGTEKVIERTTKTATAGPDGTMVRWRLAARWPDEFRDRGTLEVVGAGGGPVQVDSAPVLERLMRELDRIAENTAATDELLIGIEATSSEPAAS